MKSELKEILINCKNELDDIEQRIQTIDPFDKEMKYLTDYTLIRTCGTVEVVYRSIIADYFVKFNDDKINNYLENKVRKGSNSAKYDNMCKMLKEFDNTWCREFKNKTERLENSQRIITSSNSLVENRHRFAHGKSSSASFYDIKNYYLDVLELIYLLDETIGE